MKFLKKKRSKSRAYIFFGYGVVVSIVLSVLAMFGSKWVAGVVANYGARHFQTTLDGYVKTLDQEVMHLEALATQLSQMTWIRRIMFMQGDRIDKARVSDYSLYEYQQQIRALKQSSRIISDIGIVFAKKNLVIASYGKSNIDFLANNALKVDCMTSEDWRSIDARLFQHRYLMYNNASIRKYNVPFRGVLMVIPIRDGTTLAVKAALFITIQHENLYKHIEPLIRTGIGEVPRVHVFDQCTGDSLLSVGKQTSEPVQTIESISTKVNMVFSVDLPEHIVSSDAVRMRNTLLAIAAGIWLTSILSLLLVDQRLLRPLESIMHMFSDANKNSKRFIQEVDTIQRGILDLQQQTTQLESKLIRQQVFARSAAFLALMKGDYDNGEELKKIAEVAGLKVNWQSYCACIILPLLGKSRERPDAEQLRRYCEATRGQYECINESVDMLPVVLFCLQNKAQFKDAATEFLSRFPNYCMATGTMADGLGDVQESYRTALVAKDYRVVSEGFRVIRYSETLLQKGGYYLPQDIEYTLLQAIRNGLSDRALAIFEDLYQRNVQENGVTHASVSNYLYNIYLSVLKLQHEEQLSACVSAWVDGVDLHETKQRVEKVVRDISALFAERIRSTPSLASEMVAYVHSNLFNSSLSLTMVA